MAYATVTSPTEGPLEFHCPNTGGAVRLVRDVSNPSTWRQICRGGAFLGETLHADSSTLDEVARAWVAARQPNPDTPV